MIEDLVDDREIDDKEGYLMPEVLSHAILFDIDYGHIRKDLALSGELGFFERVKRWFKGEKNYSLDDRFRIITDALETLKEGKSGGVFLPSDLPEEDMRRIVRLAQAMRERKLEKEKSRRSISISRSKELRNDSMASMNA